jgi:hypothetical protein
LIKPAKRPISEISKLIKFYQTLTIVLPQQKTAARRPFRTGALLSGRRMAQRSIGSLPHTWHGVCNT